MLLQKFKLLSFEGRRVLKNLINSYMEGGSKTWDDEIKIASNKCNLRLRSIGDRYPRLAEKLGDLKNAAKHYKNVIKKNPNHVKSRENLIFIYKNLNKFREAKKECEIIYMLDRSVYNSIAFCRE